MCDHRIVVIECIMDGSLCERECQGEELEKGELNRLIGVAGHRRRRCRRRRRMCNGDEILSGARPGIPIAAINDFVNV